MSEEKEKHHITTAKTDDRSQRSRSLLESTSQHGNNAPNVSLTHNILDTRCITIERKAIDLTGEVGYQYDASRDKVLENSQLLEQSPLSTPSNIPTICGFIKADITNIDTLLKMLHIDDQLFLNLLLNFKTSSTVGTHFIAFNCKEWISKCTRILFYRRIHEKLCWPHKSEDFRIENKVFKSEATHFIASVYLGMEFVIVLKARSNISTREMDKHLHKLCMDFRKDEEPVDFGTLRQYLTDFEIISTYGNLANPFFNEDRSTTHDQTCSPRQHPGQPIFYQLQPIQSLYRMAWPYHEINIGIIYSIQSELLTLRHLFDEAQKLFKDQLKSECGQQFLKAQQQFHHMQCSLSHLTADIHRGLKSEHELAEYFIQDHYQSLVTDIQNLIHECQSTSLDKSSLASTQMTHVNVLLLGETGVGKSTFINAFANYQRFTSLSDARQNKPVVLIPSSFIITRGAHFEEITVCIGKPSPDEVNNKQGHSVTQQCQSHDLSIDNGTKLSIIDVPGIGDTRGAKQDDINMKNIVSFVQQLDHLNVICILLKPNVERLHLSFRLCLNQLFDMLGPNVRKNVVFCFTNTRATFYAPGNTADLLCEFLQQLPGERIVFNRSNTFCFDSESFRYLAATKQGIKFEEKQERDYEESWQISAKETKRFVTHIRTLKTVSFTDTDKLDSNVF